MHNFIDQFNHYIGKRKHSAFGKLGRNLLAVMYSLIFERLINILNITIPINSKTFWGDKMKVFLPETVSSTIYKFGIYEEGLTMFMLNYLIKGMTFYDVGAHFGYFSLMGSKLVGDEGKVHSFEPTTNTFKILKENTINKKNILLNNLAVWTEDKNIELNDFGVEFSAYNSFTHPRIDVNLPTNKISIAATSIDSYVENSKSIPDFIKIDVESAEYQVLKGSENTIDKYHPIITLEVGDKDLPGIITSRELIDYLEGKGYQSFEYKKGKINKHQLKKRYSYDNILFLPEQYSQNND